MNALRWLQGYRPAGWKDYGDEPQMTAREIAEVLLLILPLMILPLLLLGLVWVIHWTWKPVLVLFSGAVVLSQVFP